MKLLVTSVYFFQVKRLVSDKHVSDFTVYDPLGYAAHLRPCACSGTYYCSVLGISTNFSPVTVRIMKVFPNGRTINTSRLLVNLGWMGGQIPSPFMIQTSAPCPRSSRIIAPSDVSAATDEVSEGQQSMYHLQKARNSCAVQKSWVKPVSKPL